MSSVLFFDAIFPHHTPCVQVQSTTLTYTIEGKRTRTIDCCKVVDCLGIAQIEKDDVIISVNGQPLINQQLPNGISHFDHTQKVLSNTTLRRTVRFMRCAPGCMDNAVNVLIIRVSLEEAVLFFDTGENNDNSQGWILHGSTSISDVFTPTPLQETTPKVFPGAKNGFIREDERIRSYHPPEINDHDKRDVPVPSKNRWTEEMCLSETMNNKQHSEQLIDRHQHRSHSSTSSSSSSIGSNHRKHRHNQMQQIEEVSEDHRHRLSTEEQERNEIRRHMEVEKNRRLEDERWELQRLQERRRAEEEELRLNREEQERNAMRRYMEEESNRRLEDERWELQRLQERRRAEEEELRLNREYEMMEYHRRALPVTPIISAANMVLPAPGHYVPYMNDPYGMTHTAHQQTSDQIENLVKQRVAAEVEQRMRVALVLSKATAELGNLSLSVIMVKINSLISLHRTLYSLPHV